MGVIFFVIWLVLFIIQNYNKKEILVISTIFAFAGPIADMVYTQDWWHPIMLTHNLISPGPIIVGFSIGGIAAMIYRIIIHKVIHKTVFDRLVNKKIINRDIHHFRHQDYFRLLYPISLLAAIFLVSFYLFDFNSLLTTILAFLIPTIIIWLKRRDLFIGSIATGMSLVVLAFIVYSTLEFLTPGWVYAFYLFNNTPKIVILNVPLDDIIWYFLAGMFIYSSFEYFKR